MKKFDPYKDYYAVLGVKEDASREEIERKYRSRAREQHPDRGGSEEQMKLLNEAHEVLSDPETRRAYDSNRYLKTILHNPPPTFDPQAASKAGNLSIPVSDGDFIGLLISAVTCLALGLPFLVLIETQWVFFLMPLRLLTLGVLLLGVFMAHSALRMKHRQMKKANPRIRSGRFILNELIFWIVTLSSAYLIYLLLYADR
jgi:hypothetical protein